MCRDTGQIDFDQVEVLAKEHRPKLLFCGGTAYPRIIDFARFCRDRAFGGGHRGRRHRAYCRAGGRRGASQSRCRMWTVVTTTTHKSLRGPRGGMILCRAQYAEALDKAVFPGLQGGPHNSTTAAIAVALKEGDERGV